MSVQARSYVTRDSAAWCKGCRWEAVNGASRYDCSAAARRHVEQTGHTVELERFKAVIFEPVR